MSYHDFVRCDGTRDGKPCGREVRRNPATPLQPPRSRAFCRGWETDAETDRDLCATCAKAQTA